MAKSIYRAISVNRLEVDRLSKEGERIVVGCDAAKRRWYGALMKAQGEVIAIVRWDLVTESRALVDKLCELVQAGARVEVVVESTGTYADPWCALIREHGLSVYRVSSKHAHDYQEIYDGVPSGHDAKSAAILAKLHLEGRSRLWGPVEAKRSEMRARTDMLDWLTEEATRWRNRLETRLARHWPELLALLKLTSLSLIKLLHVFGGPQGVAASREQAGELLRRCSRRLSEEKISRVLESAKQTMGVRMSGSQVTQVRWIAVKLIKLRRESAVLRREVEETVKGDEEMRRVGAEVGLCTAAVLHATMGSFAEYGSVRAVYHAAGVNLKVHSSGEPRKEPRLRITKRGSSTARRWLYFATLRWIRADRIARAWYEHKVAHNGGVKLKGIIALMRKLLAGLYHVARGGTFDSKRLFDLRRLALPAAAKAV